MVHVVLVSRDPNGDEQFPEAYSSESFVRLYVADGTPANAPGGIAVKPKVLKAETSDGENLTLASTAYYIAEHGAEAVNNADTKKWARDIFFAYLKKIGTIKPGGYLLMSEVLKSVELEVPAPAPDTTPGTATQPVVTE